VLEPELQHLVRFRFRGVQAVILAAVFNASACDTQSSCVAASRRDCPSICSYLNLLDDPRKRYRSLAPLAAFIAVSVYHLGRLPSINKESL
jgi:hypothetical protein